MSVASSTSLVRIVAAGLVLLATACGDDGLAYQTTYTFDTRLAAALYSDKEAGGWEEKRRVEYSYDADGHLTGVNRDERIDEAWQHTGSVELSWNGDGYLERVVKLRTHGDLVGGEEWSFAYDGRGNLVHEEKRIRLDSKVEPTWTAAGTFENHYDHLDRLVERVGFTPDEGGAEPVEVLRVVYTHNGDDALEEEIDSYREADRWIDDVRYTLTYSGGDVDEVVTHHVHEEAWIENNKFSFRFDDLGTLAELTGSHRLGDTGEWVEDETYAYSYDANDDPSTVMDYVTRDGERIEEQRVVYQNEDARVVLPFNYTRTRMHGLRDQSLMKFLFVQGM